MNIKKTVSGGTNIYRYVSSNETILQRKGELYCFISVKSEKLGNRDTVLKIIWDAIYDAYVQSSQTSVIESLKETVKSGEAQLRKLIHDDKNFKWSGINLDFILVVVRETNVYFARFGNQNIFLLKNGRKIDIGKHLEKNKVCTGSIILEESDIFILSTQGIDKDVVEVDDLRTIFSSIKEDEGIFVLTNNEDFIDKIDKPDIEEPEIEISVQDEDSSGLGRVEDTEHVRIASLEKNGKVEEESVENANKSTLINQIPEEQTIEESVHSGTKQFVQTSRSVIKSSFVRFFKFIRQDGWAKKLEIESSKENLSKSQEIMQMRENSYGQIKRSPAERVRGSVGAIRNGLDAILSAIAFVIEKFVQIVGGVMSIIVGLLSKKYGRSPVFKRWAAKFSQSKISLVGARSVSVRGEIVDDSRTRNKQIAFFLLVLLIAGSIYWGVKYTRQVGLERKTHKYVQERLDVSLAYVDEADDYARSDPELAQKKLEKANNLIKEVNKQAMSDVDKKNVAALVSRISDVEDRVYYREVLAEGLGNIVVYLDGKLSFGTKSSPSDITITQDKNGNDLLFISDAGEKTVFRVSVYNKTIAKITDRQELLKAPKFVADGVGGIFVYDEYSGMVYSPFDGNGKNMDFVGIEGLEHEEFENSGVSALAIFTQKDNVYTINTSEQSITKASKHEDGSYGLPLVFYEGEQLGRGVDLFADSSNVYSLSAGDNALRRYKAASGVLQDAPLEVSGARPQILNAVCGYTSSFTKNIYIFDQENHRIVVLNKVDDDKVVMTRQLVYRGDISGAFENVKDIGVDSSEKYLYLLDGLRVWRIKLR